MAADVPTIKSIFQRPSHLKPQVHPEHHEQLGNTSLVVHQPQQHSHSDTELLGRSTNISTTAKPSPRKLIKSAAEKEKALKKQCPASWGDLSSHVDEDEQWLEKRRNEQRQQQQLEREQNYQLKESQRRWRRFQGDSLDCSPSATAVASAATAALASTNSFAFMSSKDKHPKAGVPARLNIDTACTSSSSVVSISAATARYLSATTPTPDGHSPHTGFGRRDVKSTSSSPRGHNSRSQPPSPLRSPVVMSPKSRHAIVPSMSPRRGPVGFKSGSTGSHEPAWQQQKVVPLKLSQYRLWMFIIAAGTLVNGLLSVILIESFLGIGSGSRGPQDCTTGNCTSHRHFAGFVGSRVVLPDTANRQQRSDLLQLQQAILDQEDDDGVSVLILGKSASVQSLKALQQRLKSEDKHRELLTESRVIGLGKEALEKDPRGTEMEEEGTSGEEGLSEKDTSRVKQQREERMKLVKELSESRAGLMSVLLDLGWVVTPHSEVPGVFVLERREDFSTALLVQDACYLFTVGKSAHHNHYTGVWFARETIQSNLSTLASIWEASADESANGMRGGEGVLGLGMWTGGSGMPTPAVRDLSQIDLSKNVCTAFEVDPEEDPARFPVSPTSTTTIDDLDLPVLLQRANKSYGRMVGPRGLQEFVVGSSSTAKKKLRTGSEGFEERDVAVVGRYDSHVGHFGESVVAMLEAAQHFVVSSPTGKGEEQNLHKGLSPENITLFFPSDKALRSNWSVNIGQLLFGAPSQALAGRIEGRPVCFKFAFFLMSARHLNSSVQGLRDRSWRMVDWANAILLSRRAGLKEEDIEREEEEREEEEKASWWEQGSRRMRGFSRGEGRVEDLPEEGALSARNTVRELSRGTAAVELRRIEQEGRIPRLEHTLRKFYPGWPSLASQEMSPSPRSLREGEAIPVRRWQVTVVEREGQRTVSNMRHVMDVVRRRFPDIPVEKVRFAQASLIEQVAIMQHSALMVSMHGATLSNVIFLPRGSTVVEMFPYLFQSESYMGLCRRGGVVYFRWENEHLENSTYTNNCMKEKGYDRLSMSQCRHNRECLFCARDRSITAVNIAELDIVLAKAQKSVHSFLSKHNNPVYKRTRLSVQ